jgi:poly(3-hydroxybutyrate) depolymerase
MSLIVLCKSQFFALGSAISGLRNQFVTTPPPRMQKHGDNDKLSSLHIGGEEVNQKMQKSASETTFTHCANIEIRSGPLSRRKGCHLCMQIEQIAQEKTGRFELF